MKRALVPLLLFITVAAFAKDRSYQDGKLLDVASKMDGGAGIGSTSGNMSAMGLFRTGHAIFTVKVADIIYVLQGEKLNYKSKDYGKGLIVGDPVKAAVEGQEVYLLLPDGKDLKTHVLTRQRVGQP